MSNSSKSKISDGDWGVMKKGVVILIMPGELSATNASNEKLLSIFIFLMSNSSKFKISDGDWVCSEEGCGNINYARRTECNKCKQPRPKYAPKLKKVGSEIGKSAAQKSGGLFSAEDWQCSFCGNINWARRSDCNLCSQPKMGKVEERTGFGGGFNEREEIEYIQRSSDGEYDDFGRKKKKYRHKSDEEKTSGKEKDSSQSSHLKTAELTSLPYKEESDDSDNDDDDDDDNDSSEADLSKYNLDSDNVADDQTIDETNADAQKSLTQSKEENLVGSEAVKTDLKSKLSKDNKSAQHETDDSYTRQPASHSDQNSPHKHSGGSSKLSVKEPNLKRSTPSEKRDTSESRSTKYKKSSTTRVPIETSSSHPKNLFPKEHSPIQGDNINKYGKARGERTRSSSRERKSKYSPEHGKESRKEKYEH